MTPQKLEILLKCYYREDYMSPGFIDSEERAADSLLREGLIEETHQGWTATPLGKAHVMQIMQLPYPKCVYVGLEGKVIEI